MPQTRSRGPGRPPAAKADETRKRIVGAARQVFSERGYEGTTFQAIAAQADLTRPAINHYYPSKLALYREVVASAQQAVIVGGIDRARAETTLLGRLTALIVAATEANQEDVGTSAFLVTHVLESQRHPELNAAESDAVCLSREFLTWAAKDAIERGEVSGDVDAAVLAESLLAVICGVGFYAGYLQNSHKIEAVVSMLRQLLEGGLWHSRA